MANPESDFIFNSNTGIITGYVGTNKDVIIPSTIGGVAVTGIDDEAFFDKGLTSVKFPSGLLTLGDSSFAYNELKNVEIPESVNFIAFNALSSNSLLERITVYNKNAIIQSGAFSFNSYSLIIVGHDPSTAKDYATINDEVFQVIPNPLPRPTFPGVIRENYPNGDMVIVGDLVEYPPELEGARNHLIGSPTEPNKMTHRTSAFYDLSGATTGGMYTLSFEAKMVIPEPYSSDIVDIHINEEFLGTVTISMEYARYSVNIDVPNGATALEFRMWLGNPQNNIYYIHNIMLSPFEEGVPAPFNLTPEDLGLVFPDWVTHFKYGQTKDGFLMSEFREDSSLSVIAEERNGVFSISGNLSEFEAPLIEDGLILHYDFRGRGNSDTDREIAYDLSPIGINAPLSYFSFNESSGWVSEGLAFDNTEFNYVYSEMSDDMFLNGTLVTYIKPLLLGTEGAYEPSILSNYAEYGGVAQGYTVIFFQDKIELIYGNVNGIEEAVVINHTLPLNEWSHVAVSHENNTFKVYLNGEEVLNHVPSVPLHTTYSFFVIGSARNDTPISTLKGVVASVQAYDRALTPQEVLQNYEYEKRK